jgi:hypothetical protein
MEHATNISNQGSRARAGAGLAKEIAALGKAFVATLEPILAELPAASSGPVALAKALGLDKVFPSRLLKAVRKSHDPLATVHGIPGPEPLARFLKAARRAGVERAKITAAEAQLTTFKDFVRLEVGDRGALEALISTWLPEARRDFELRRKQAAFRAMSQLRGVSIRARLAAVFLAPSEVPGRLDLVWLMGYFGLLRLRPGAGVGFGTKRFVEPGSQGAGRQPLTLDGAVGDFPHGYRLDEFCRAPVARIESELFGEYAHYKLAGDAVGPGSEVDLILAELNRNELPSTVAAGSGRKAHFSSEVATPSKRLILDVFVHRDVYPNSEPELRLYDRAQGSTGDVNDPRNEAFRLDMAESIVSLGSDPTNFRADSIASYRELTGAVFERLDWDPHAFRGYRVAIDYPLLGSQIVVVFDPPEAD